LRGSKESSDRVAFRLIHRSLLLSLHAAKLVSWSGDPLDLPPFEGALPGVL
jgi:hypothetical protein